MAVDLSMTGLRGIAAGQDTLNNIQNRQINDLAMQTQELANDQTRRDMQLDQEAAQKLATLSKGTSQDVSGLFNGITDESSAAAPLDVIADVMLRGGAIKRGTDLVKAAQDIRKSEADIEKGKVDAAKTKLETVLKSADAVAQTIGVAQNQSEWRYGLAQLKKAGVLPAEQLEKLEQMDYDPDVVAYLREQALTAYQRAQLDLTSTRDSANRKQAQARIDNAQQLTTIARARLKLAEQAAARAEKNGKGATAPNKQEMDAASSAIVTQVFGGKVPTDADSKAALQAGALSVASRAQALIRENKSLDYDTAVSRAIIESQAAGDWEVTKHGGVLEDLKRTIGVGDNPETEVSFGKGRNPANAIEIPQKDGKPNPAAMKKGKYYITAKGIAKWNGSAFELVAQ